MVTFANAAADLASQWIPIITIEGFGHVDDASNATQFKYCATVPSYASGDSTYKPWLAADSWPDILREVADTQGGVPEAGSISFEILDVDNALSALIRPEANATTLTNGAITKAATSVVVDAAGGLAVDDIIFIANEALRISGIAGTTLTVARGVLDTDAQAHGDDSGVFLQPTYIKTRRVRVFVAPFDGDSAAVETDFGVYHIDRYGLERRYNHWHFEGRSKVKYFSIEVADLAAASMALDVQFNLNDRALLVFEFRGKTTDVIERASVYEAVLTAWDTTNPEFFLQAGPEIIVCEWLAGMVVRILRRGALGTRARSGDAFLVAGSSVEIVLGVHPNEASRAFRWSPGTDFAPGATPSTSRSSGTWVAGQHFVDILLCLLTSSAHADDGLELTNKVDQYGNWSSLPIGVGIGVPVAEIDVASFIDVKDSTPGHVFPNYFLEPAATTFARLASSFLKPIGAFLTVASGKIALRYPRQPLTGQSVDATWDDTVIDAVEVGPRRFEADFSAGKDPGDHFTSIDFVVRTPSGKKSHNIFRANDFHKLFGHRGYYASSEGPQVIEVPGIVSSERGIALFLKLLAMRKLFRFKRPLWRHQTSTSMAQYLRVIGDLLGVTHVDLPNEATGVRGVTAMFAEILERELEISDSFAGFRWELLGYGPTIRAGKISPSARIVSVSSNTATCQANKYTHADVRNSLPATDVAAFSDNDVVLLLELDGTQVSGTTTETVASTSGNDITLSGNFGGSLATGKTIAYAARADVVAAQSDAYVFYSDVGGKPGASTDDPWRYAEI